MKQNQNVPAHVLHAADKMLRPYGLDLSALLRKATEQHKDKRYISIAEAEDCFGLKRWTVGRLIRAGKIDAVKLAKARSGKVLIDRDSLTEYLEGCRRNVSWSVRSFFLQ